MDHPLSVSAWNATHLFSTPKKNYNLIVFLLNALRLYYLLHSHTQRHTQTGRTETGALLCEIGMDSGAHHNNGKLHSASASQSRKSG